jgi:hypothetical protein
MQAKIDLLKATVAIISSARTVPLAATKPNSL